jgi:hypothetical protein
MWKLGIACAALILTVAGCTDGSQTQTPTSATAQHTPNTPTSASAGTTSQTAPQPAGPEPTSMQQLCDMQAWPRPVPVVSGIILDDASTGALGCWDNVKAIAPDGHDVENDTASSHGIYRITDVSPAPGTLIGRNDAVTVHVVPVDITTTTPALHPCDWVTDVDAARIIGGQSPTLDPTGDEAGSVAPFCTYNFGDNGLTSQLNLPGSFAVDAAADFNTAGRGADEQSTDVAGLPGAARCITAQRDKGPLRTLNVLLSGNRLYSADGMNLSCDTLKQFAQVAISNIGR